MPPGMDWIMRHLAGEDWTTMNWYYGDNLCINIPLSIFFTIFFTVILTLLQMCIRWIFHDSRYCEGWYDGYQCGMHDKLIKLSEIKFHKGVGAYIWVSPDKYEKNLEEAYKEFKEKS